MGKEDKVIKMVHNTQCGTFHPMCNKFTFYFSVVIISFAFSCHWGFLRFYSCCATSITACFILFLCCFLFLPSFPFYSPFCFRLSLSLPLPSSYLSFLYFYVLIICGASGKSRQGFSFLFSLFFYLNIYLRCCFIFLLLYYIVT